MYIHVPSSRPKVDAEKVLADMAHRLKQLKEILAKEKKMSLENAKALLVDVMARVKV